MKEINYINKRQWLGLWHRLGACSYDKIVCAYANLLKCYGEAHRRYHNIKHINHCLSEFASVRTLASEPDILELAIWYHDVVYELGTMDNEERSALFAEKEMVNMHLPLDTVEKVKNIIIATKHNQIPESFDAKLMLDIDISNLGQAEKFKESNRLVREEYSLVQENIFNSHRTNILQLFLDRSNIYLTEFFYNKYEQSARENIAAAIHEYELDKPKIDNHVSPLWQYEEKSDYSIALTHSKTCCCSICVRTGLNQKTCSAPDDHSPSCCCSDCQRIR